MQENRGKPTSRSGVTFMPMFVLLIMVMIGTSVHGQPAYEDQFFQLGVFGHGTYTMRKNSRDVFVHYANGYGGGAGFALSLAQRFTMRLLARYDRVPIDVERTRSDFRERYGKLLLDNDSGSNPALTSFLPMEYVAFQIQYEYKFFKKPLSPFAYIGAGYIFEYAATVKGTYYDTSYNWIGRDNDPVLRGTVGAGLGISFRVRRRIFLFFETGIQAVTKNLTGDLSFPAKMGAKFNIR